INQIIGNKDSLVYASWPSYDESKTIDTKVEIAVQVNGKLRGTILVAKDASNEILQQEALKLETVKTQIENKTIFKIICVPNRIVNIVVG
ncbi:MAG: leucine--tRNA ligase, partial [Bacilli bacterium]